MKKLAFLVGIVFFTTVAFSQDKPAATKKEMKKEPAKTEQVKPAQQQNAATPAPAKKEASTPSHHKKHKDGPKKAR